MHKRGADPEHSLVTILAVDTVGSTEHISGLDPDDAETFLDNVMSYVSRKIEEAGGILASFHGDGGLAIFGWPNSLENHADCACEAAWAIQHPQIPLAAPDGQDDRQVLFRLGIHSGLVRFRQLRLGVGSNLDLVGATVHMAAALQKQAPPSGILISANTRELCSGELDVEPVRDVDALANFNTTVFELRGRPPSPTAVDTVDTYPFPIVGRDGELRMIADTLGRDDEAARVMSVIGEPGIGKSRLAAAVVDGWPERARNVHIFRGDTRKSTTPFAAMKALVLSALYQGEGRGAALTAGDLSAAGISEETVSKLGSILVPQDGGRRSKSVSLSGKGIARTLVEVYAQLVANGPALTVIEDLHLIDPESVECLRHFGELVVCRDIGLLITGRPEAEFEARRIGPDVMFLKPLAPADMAVLAEKLTPEAPLDHSLVEEALRRADGVPFVLEQMLLSVDPDQPDQDIQLPQSVESLIHGRINKLSNPAKALVQAASVLGEETETALVARVLDSRVEDLREPIRELQKLGLVYPGQLDRLRFRHSIIADACSTTVPRGRRRGLHSRAIDAISSIYANLDEHYERIAFHAECAGDDENALEYLWLAGLQARRSSATGSLLLIFQHAEQCIERLGETADDRYVDFVLMACAALLQIGEFSRMKGHIPRALEIARDRQQPEKVCGALCHQSTVCWFDGRFAEGLTASLEALELARELELLPCVFAAQLSLANIHHCMGHVDQALQLQAQLCDMFDGELANARLGATGMPSSTAHAFMGWFLLEVGRYDEALNHAETALSLAKAHSDSYAEVLALTSLGRALLMQHRPDEALHRLMAAKDISQREGYDAILPHLTGRMAAALARTGQAEQAVAMVEELLRRVDEQRTGRLEVCHFHIGYAEALFWAGRQEDALTTLDRVVKMTREIESPTLIVQALGLRAMIEPEGMAAQRDVSEQARLCAEFGLVAWRPG